MTDPRIWQAQIDEAKRAVQALPPADAMPIHEFVDDGRLALVSPFDSFGRPACSWDEDGRGACDRPRSDPIHRVRHDHADIKGCACPFPDDWERDYAATPGGPS